jgi:tRNA nucleotidyltransferase (CCA-adding enzyme)
MNLPLNLAQRDIFDAIREEALASGVNAYLVGGAVRDSLLNESRIDDLDFAVEGDAIAFARAAQAKLGGDVVPHERFNTATWTFHGESVDVAMTRKEAYPRPAALPNIERADIETDLHRRDFTINAIALRVSDSSIIDPLNGREDLQNGAMRVTHNQSFIDDPTRILRGARYAARFGYSLEPKTKSLVESGLSHIRALSGERMKYDMELIFADRQPAGALLLLIVWGVFRALGIPAPTSQQLDQRFARARKVLATGAFPFDTLNLHLQQIIHAVGWGAITYNMGQLSMHKWMDWIPYETHTRDALVSLGALGSLSSQNFHRKISEQSNLLKDFDGLSLLIGFLFDNNTNKQTAMRNEWAVWRWVKPTTMGDDLIARGVPQGPIYSKILSLLRSAWLDGEVVSPEQEEMLLKKLIDNEAAW